MKKQPLKSRRGMRPATGRQLQAPVNRLTRTRQRTYEKLIRAAQTVMGRKGVESATIAEITSEADVGFGSFYDYFTSKEDIAGQVFARRSKELADELDAIFARVEDLELAVSFVHRWFIERGRRDPVWGWFILRAGGALQQAESTFRINMRRDIQRAADAGRVKFSGIDTLVTITLASIFAVMRRQLEGNASSESASEMVEALLRMYGVTHARARKLAYEPLPDWLSASASMARASPHVSHE